MSDAKTLPACPLCGSGAIKWLHVDHVECRNPKCALFSDNGLGGAEWRRLASPLAPEIVAVLRAVETLELYDAARGYETDSVCAEALMKARGAWINAGRPGLPPEGKEGA